MGTLRPRRPLPSPQPSPWKGEGVGSLRIPRLHAPRRPRPCALIAAGLLAVAAAAFAEVGAADGTVVLDDFESDRASRYDLLEHPIEDAAARRVEWRRVACGPDEAANHCLRLGYAFLSEDAPDATFAIDLGRLDARAYDHLAVRLRGDAGSGFNPALKVGFRRPKPGGRGLFEDGSEVVTGVGADWRRVLVPLNRLTGVTDWSDVGAFFVALESRRASVRRGGYFLDDVALVRTGKRGPSIRDRVVPARKQAWLRSLGGEQAAQPKLRERLAGWPRRLLAEKRDLPADPRAFLLRVARDTWRGLDSLTDREHGLPVDNVILDRTSLAPRDARIGDYTNVTSIGLHLIAVVAARELGLVSAPEARHRLEKSLATLERLERYDGFFYNYYDTTTLERTSNFVSFVDSSWLTAALIVVRRSVPELGDRATRLIDAGNYAFFYDPVAQQMSQGYYVNVPTWSEYHYGTLYTEARLGSVIAIGKGDVPEEHWFRLWRTFPPDARWQTQPPKGRAPKVADGHRYRGGWYEWKGVRYVPSWGGSMFEALMPTLVLDERRFAPRSLGANDEAHATIQARYATEQLGSSFWGFSPAAVPGGDGYGEYGVPVLGALGYPAAAVTPHAAALALAIMPEAAVANLDGLARRYDVYGDFGFYDAVDPRSGAVAYRYLALDQAMILISIANHLKDGVVQKRFASDPIVARALPLFAKEDFFR